MDDKVGAAFDADAKVIGGKVGDDEEAGDLCSEGRGDAVVPTAESYW